MQPALLGWSWRFPYVRLGGVEPHRELLDALLAVLLVGALPRIADHGYSPPFLFQRFILHITVETSVGSAVSSISSVYFTVLRIEIDAAR